MSASEAPARRPAARAGGATASPSAAIAAIRKKTFAFTFIACMNAGRVRFLAVTAACALLAVPSAARGDRAAEVDPMIGTSAPGFVFPGASVPFGMVQNSPDTEGSGFAYSGYLF